METTTARRRGTRKPSTDETVYRLDGPLRWATGENRLLVRKGHVEPGWRVLDAGGGTGYLTIPLAEAVAAGGRVDCIDRSAELIAVTVGKLQARRIADRVVAQQGDILALPFDDECFDAVFTSYTLHELGDRASLAIAELNRVLKPGGRAVLADYMRIADSARCREIESWYGVQRMDGTGDHIRLRFSAAEYKCMMRRAGFASVGAVSWCEFHVHVTGIKR
jgi:ubiquinone/menaquinone biosynthesis C-methylase UbiE